MVNRSTRRNPARPSTGRLVARGGEQDCDAVPMSRFAGNPSTMTSRRVTTEFACWKIRIKKPKYLLVRGSLPEAVFCIKEVEMVDSVDDLKSSLRDARIAFALDKIIHSVSLVSGAE